ncbi:DNA mismatch repair endonuclease MutL [Natrononativus amylolyticus]|uniref:DNA mismatch repair endonuclease MutL n=1 Tax=Natrononativus amylolyticus TaxID=2963434 RepID=UPI0020CCDF38|nr:DNA mismatch repair endonuclease MutL [Natrononativus amylolyticus]
MSDGSTGETAIRRLDEDTVARIAAGEVVERPASAVKELVENSLDADATRIDVSVEAGGTELIRVADDGRGMTEADVRAAVRQHTTSKLEGLSDLESGVATLGFRGEALHTIGSVSRLEIRTRPRARADEDAAGERAGTDAAGTKLVYDAGTVETVEPAGCPEGTVVGVTDLFSNTPARRKFLKTTATEFAHVNRVVTRYALANPDVAVSLSHDGREVFATTGQGDLQAAVLSVYGREVATAMLPVEADADDLPVGPLESVSGLVSHPETNRSSREYLATYVNGRAVTSDAIREGIMGAYGTQLGGDRYPFVVCFLEVPGDAVDVNVHPRKREVRFDDDDAVRRQVDAAVESALLEHGLLRSSAPRGRSAPAETRVEPSREVDLDDATAPRGNDASAAESRGAHSEASSSPPTAGSGRSSEVEPTAGTTSESQSSRTDRGRPSADRSASSQDRSREVGRSSPAEPSSGAAAPEDSSTADGAAGDWTRPADEGHEPDRAAAGREARSGDRRSLAGPTDQRTLEGESAAAESEYDSLPSLSVLGQFRDTYLVCESPDGLLLVDQHAADERVNYERLREAFADDPTTQALASPVELEVTAAESEAFAQYREALARLGFVADRVDDRTVAVTTVPAVLEKTLAPDRLRDVLSAVLEGDRESGAETIDALADEFLGDLACHPSITGNTSLTEGSVVDLLAALDGCENPYACPHGRPVIVAIDDAEIDERFERDYPGHGG